jgi:prolyl-tRNA synthetase
MSQLFLRTLRQDPADAEVPSHRLLVRAGYIRRAAPGGYTWLPLGYRVLRNVEQVVREEMDAAGFQEVHFPALLPREPYERSGRWTDYGDDLFRLVDRKGADHLLAPTHEEMFTLLVKDLYSSYKDLPTSIYQIQWKFRDEPRPRAGLLRGREFLMKDSYSFDLDDAGLKASYDAHRVAYQRLFDRFGLDYVIVSAVSGAMGGSASEEFLLPTEVGEDTFVRCTSCDYAANTEAYRTPAPDPLDATSAPAAHVETTPDTPTIDTLVGLSNARDDLRRSDRNWVAADTLKNVVVMLRHPDGQAEPLVVGVPGDREVDMKRLTASVAPAVPEPFAEEDFATHPGLVRGYIGPTRLGERSESGIRYLTDPRVVPGTRWITGANETGRHVYDLTAGRDFVADGTIEAAEVRDGDACPSCGAVIELARGLEIGHIFQLGRRYAEALDLRVQDESGEQVVVTMGSYGVGVSRLVAAIAEQTHDELGLCWPAPVAPAHVHIVAAGRSEEIAAGSVDLARRISEAGLDVLLDDRQGSAGVKFADAELIGVPVILVVGRGLASGVVEVRDRRTGERFDVAVDEATARVRDLVGAGVGAQ